MRRSRHALVTLLFAATSLAGGVPAAAQPAAASDEARTEARARFDRGLRLFDEGDNPGALAEFRRTYELIPNPIVIYNIGLVYAAMGRPVEAADALEKLLSSPGNVAPDKLERARAVRRDSLERIAEIVVGTNVESATIEVDGIQVGKAPLAAPVRVASGTRIVGAVAPGYAPARKEVTVAGRARAQVDLQLSPIQGRLAHLTVKSRLPGAEVLVNGQPMGKTPLAASLTLAPGRQRVEVRRAGYLTARTEMDLGDGANGEVSMDPEEDAAALGSSGALLALQVSEPQAVVSVDGRLRGAYAGPLRLPTGLHHVRVERGGFLSHERQVDVRGGAATSLRIDLEPTAETRASYVAGARRWRTWGWIALATGVASAGGGAGFLAYNAGQKNDARSAIDAFLAQTAPGANGRCDPKSQPPTTLDACSAEQDQLFKKHEDLGKRDTYGWIAVGVGAAAIGAGAYLLLAGDDPSKYDRKPSGELVGAVHLVPANLGAGSAGAVLLGRF